MKSSARYLKRCPSIHFLSPYLGSRGCWSLYLLAVRRQFQPLHHRATFKMKTLALASSCLSCHRSTCPEHRSSIRVCYSSMITSDFVLWKKREINVAFKVKVSEIELSESLFLTHNNSDTTEFPFSMTVQSNMCNTDHTEIQLWLIFCHFV